MLNFFDTFFLERKTKHINTKQRKKENKNKERKKTKQNELALGVEFEWNSR